MISAKRSKTAKVGWERRYDLKKYERYERRRSQLHAHNPPCIDAKEGDMVKIRECRPLSKTKNFIIVEKTGEYVKITGIDEKKDEKSAEARKDKASAKEKNKKAATE